MSLYTASFPFKDMRVILKLTGIPTYLQNVDKFPLPPGKTPPPPFLIITEIKLFQGCLEAMLKILCEYGRKRLSTLCNSFYLPGLLGLAELLGLYGLYEGSSVKGLYLR